VSKELKFTKGYNQAELDAWWKMVGYPGEAPRIPEWLVGKQIGRGRDAYGVYDLSSGKLDTKSRQTQKDLGEDQFKEAMDFSNLLGMYTDPFRERSSTSDLAGGILNFAMTALGGPVGALMVNLADYGNAALGNNDGTSYIDGRRSDWDRAGALAGSIYSGLGGPGSYGASGEKAPGWVKNANTGVKLLGGALAKPPEGLDFPAAGGNSTPSSGDALEVVSVGRERAPDPQNFLRYGMGPEHAFFRNRSPTAETPPPATGVAPPTSIPNSSNNFGGSLLNAIKAKYMAEKGLADGGTMVKHYPPRPKGQPSEHLRNFANLPGQHSDPRVRVALGDEPPLRQFVSKGTGAGGREDNIDAKLSENEYVIDAETVALLGDGSPEKGAKKLDVMRKQIRKHKGRALATGEISPNAKEGALQYLAEGGKVGTLASLFKRKPKPDPNARLKSTLAALDQALENRRGPITPLDMTEHFDTVMRERDAKRLRAVQPRKEDK
jgi:hypothetical protein